MFSVYLHDLCKEEITTSSNVTNKIGKKPCQIITIMTEKQVTLSTCPLDDSSH